MRKISRLSVLSILLIAALTVFGAIAVSAQDDDSVLVIALEQEPPNLWPLNNLTFGGVLESFYTRDLWDWDVERNVFPVMVTELPSPENGRVVETEEGNTAVTITLREGISWSDGTPITAADCEVWHTIRSDRSTSDNVARGTYPDNVLSLEIAEDDPLTFTVTYNGVYPDYIAGRDKPECRYPAHVFGPLIADGGKLEDSTYFVGEGDFGGFATVGYGPYAIESWNIGDSAVLVKNPNWDGQEPAWDRIVIPFIADSTQMRNALSVGEVDVTFNWSDDLQPDYAAIDGVETFPIPGVYSDALWIRMGEVGNDDNHGGDALQDPAVRAAIVHAIDRRALVEELVGPGINVPLSWYPPALWPEDLQFREYDPELAVSLLEEAGWTDTNGDGTVDKDGVELANLRFVTTENELRNNYQLFIQEYLAEIGIGTDIQIIPATTLFAAFGDGGTLTTYQWDLAIFANSADPLTPLTDRDSYACASIPGPDNPDGFNPWQFCDPEYDAVNDLIETTLPGPERDELVAESVTRFTNADFWNGLRLRSTWFAVDTNVVDAASAEGNAGSLASNWFNQIENWQAAGG
ncbi:MAG: ABC transporter substrate-binding protein [Chloroflexota bacterium]